MSIRKSRKNVLSAVVAVMSVAAIWQFYVFVTFTDAAGVVDVQGGRQHLWWAIGLGLIACIAAFLLLSALLRYDRNDEMHITSFPS
jgi:peptidoglycan/LPS O-acetylase OafA/YrhL